MILQLIRYLRRVITAHQASRRIARTSPASCAVLDLDYLRRARNRSRVRYAAQANNLTAAQTADLIALFDHHYAQCGDDYSAGERVTQTCIDRAAATATRRTDPAMPWAT